MATRSRTPQRLAPITGPFSAGNRALTQIVSGKRTHHIDVIISATVTIGTANASSIINGGNLAALFSRIGINENGTDVVDWPATMMHALTQRVAAREPADVVLSSTNQAAYNLRTLIRIPFKWPWGRAAETAYIEADPSQNTFVFLTPASDLSTANGYLVVPGASGTAAITNLNIEVYQDYDDAAIISPPYFVPQFRTLNQAVASAGTDIPFYLRSNDLLRGVMLETSALDSNGYLSLVDGVVESLRLKDDLLTYVGEPKVSTTHLRVMETMQFAGNIMGSPDNFFDFQRWGQLSKVYNPAKAGNNLRFEMDQAIPATYTNAQAYAGLIQLVRINGRTAAGLPAGMDGI